MSRSIRKPLFLRRDLKTSITLGLTGTDTPQGRLGPQVWQPQLAVRVLLTPPFSGLGHRLFSGPGCSSTGEVTSSCLGPRDSVIWVSSVVSAELETVTQSHTWSLIMWNQACGSVGPPITCKQRSQLGSGLNSWGRRGGVARATVTGL